MPLDRPRWMTVCWESYCAGGFVEATGTRPDGLMWRNPYCRLFSTPLRMARVTRVFRKHHRNDAPPAQIEAAMTDPGIPGSVGLRSDLFPMALA